MGFEIWHIWLLVAVFLFMIEIFMTSFIAVIIGVGALVTGVGAYIGLSVTQQLFLFAGFTFLSLFIIRPLAKRYIFKAKDFVSKNANALLGQKATVVEIIDPNKLQGRVEVDGDYWKAVSFDGKAISKGQIVTIVSYDSIVLTVK
ncbi:NfeD family protein [Ancylomarina euxinus]|uniref:NfeD family protein n=1 Tax=Ancylomarina euxinus TaxID=2283627 RepID=A0A425XZJ3_9BACT|nr:NfeD family protein [Ancylomarina euxinus]MCZ4695481.1 NfeD family protein [Ancylomarina euxinus]MUP15701.1 NfeD family protein [Ancylomarina euxinus]RRG20694.1 NfeD family protein [Ancylomarina euxinus]